MLRNAVDPMAARQDRNSKNKMERGSGPTWLHTGRRPDGSDNETLVLDVTLVSANKVQSVYACYLPTQKTGSIVSGAAACEQKGNYK